jgi:hypothetical protein
MRGHAVDLRGLHHRGLEARAPHAGLRRAAEALHMRHRNRHRFFGAAGQRHRHAVLDRLLDAQHAFVAERFVTRGLDQLTQIPRQAHCGFPFVCNL